MSWVKGVSKSMVVRTMSPITVGTSAVRCAAAQIAENFGANQGVTVQADSANSGTIYIGDSTVTTANGIELAASSSYTIPVFDPYGIWAIASASAQVLRVSYV